MRRIVPPVLVASILVLLGSTIHARAAEPGAPQAGWLGIYLGGEDAPPADATGETPLRGVRVRAVVEDSPAESARLRASDRILAVDGVAVSTEAELMERMRSLQPDATVSLTVLRGKGEINRMLRIGARPASFDRLRPIEGWIGVEAITLPPSLRAHFGAPDNAGILISSVTEGSPAESAGIRVGDVVYDVGGTPVTSLGTLGRGLTEAGVENTVDIGVARDGARIVVTPTIARRP